MHENKSNVITKLLNQLTEEPLPVFLQDRGGGTCGDHYRRLHHVGMGPRCPMGSSVDDMIMNPTVVIR
jgi:hypothetical protein